MHIYEGYKTANNYKQTLYNTIPYHTDKQINNLKEKIYTFFKLASKKKYKTY